MDIHLTGSKGVKIITQTYILKSPVSNMSYFMSCFHYVEYSEMLILRDAK